jgi:hypothetical protein
VIEPAVFRISIRTTLYDGPVNISVKLVPPRVVVVDVSAMAPAVLIVSVPWKVGAVLKTGEAVPVAVTHTGFPEADPVQVLVRTEVVADVGPLTVSQSFPETL